MVSKCSNPKLKRRHVLYIAVLKPLQMCTVQVPVCVLRQQVA